MTDTRHFDTDIDIHVHVSETYHTPSVEAATRRARQTVRDAIQAALTERLPTSDVAVDIHVDSVREVRDDK